VVIMVPVVVIMSVAAGVVRGLVRALTGRRRRHSTAGLTVVSTTVLPLANLGQVVREGEA
jgi:hypothetical protein